MRPEYPRSLHEFRKLFGDEAACRQYLARSRWPEGFRCPRCQHDDALDLPARLLWRCRRCGYDTSVTAGTVLHRTKLPLTQWFWAAYLVSTQTPGFSALQLQRQLGLHRYETAWAMLHKLRRVLSGLDSHQAIDLLIDRLKKSRNNLEFLMQVSKNAPGSADD